MCLRTAVWRSLTRSVRQVGIIRAVTETEPTLYCSDCLMTFHTDGSVCPNLSCGSDKPETGWGQMYQPGSMIDRTYRVSRRLALGGAGVTYLVRLMDDSGDETGPWIALKLLFASRDHGAYLRRLATNLPENIYIGSLPRCMSLRACIYWKRYRKLCQRSDHIRRCDSYCYWRELCSCGRCS